MKSTEFVTTLFTVSTKGAKTAFKKSARPVVGLFGPPKMILKLRSAGLGKVSTSPSTTSSSLLIKVDLWIFGGA